MVSEELRLSLSPLGRFDGKDFRNILRETIWKAGYASLRDELTSWSEEAAVVG
jgi:hypothetical protein